MLERTWRQFNGWIFPRITLYVKLSKNKVEIKHIESGQSIVRISSNPFSSDRLILSNYELAEKFLRIVIGELLTGEKKFMRPIEVVLQIIDKDISIIEPIERRAYQDSMEHAGAKSVWICEYQNTLSDEEVMAITNAN
ncbi:MAG: hypothetical protein ACJAUD_001636 [Crocinitomicaceae bacterium]|jgi:hypothetical protein